MRLLKNGMLLAVIGLVAASPVFAQSIQINEIRIDQNSGDTDEYFELIGPPNASLDGYWYLVIGDGTGGSGTVETAVNLNGYTLQADGLAAFTDSDAGADSLTGYDYVLAGNALNFENSDNVTHLLVTAYTGTSSSDLDTNDDCVLDSTPWTSLEDLVAMIESDNPPVGTECHYGPPQAGPDGSFVPGHIYRCGSGWQVGTFTILGGQDTPGEPNLCPVPVQPTTWGRIKSRID